MLITAPRNCWQDVAPRVFDAVLASDAANWPDTTTPRTARPVIFLRPAFSGTGRTRVVVGAVNVLAPLSR